MIPVNIPSGLSNPLTSPQVLSGPLNSSPLSINHPGFYFTYVPHDVAHGGFYSAHHHHHPVAAANLLMTSSVGPSNPSHNVSYDADPLYQFENNHQQSLDANGMFNDLTADLILQEAIDDLPEDMPSESSFFHLIKSCTTNNSNTTLTATVDEIVTKKAPSKATSEKTNSVSSNAKVASKSTLKKNRPRLRNFLCTYPNCDKSFADNAHLKDHLFVHTGEKNLKCPHCEKSFARIASLRSHIRVHTGEKPFLCPQLNCNKRYSSRGALRMHVALHNNAKSSSSKAMNNNNEVSSSVDTADVHSCQECEMPCSCQLSLENHIKSAHCQDEDGKSDDESTSDSTRFREHVLFGQKQESARNVHNDDLYTADTNVIRKNSLFVSASYTVESIESDCYDIDDSDHTSIIDSASDHCCNDSIDSDHTSIPDTYDHMSDHVSDSTECSTLCEVQPSSPIMLAHTKESSNSLLACEVCSCTFQTKLALRVHFRRVHEGDDPYACHRIKCRRLVTKIREQNNTIMNLKLELEKLSKMNDQRSVTSEQSKVGSTPVKKAFISLKSNSAGATGTSIAASNSDNTNSCPAKPMVAPLHLLQDGIKPFQCMICHRLFANYFQLAFHAKQHSNAKECEVTGDQTPIPVGPKYCPVEGCEFSEAKGKSMKTLQIVKRHWQRVHQNERPFVCTDCPLELQKSFKTRDNLTAHRKECKKRVQAS